MAKRQTIDATFGPYTLSFPNITAPDEKYDVYTANGVDDPNSDAMKKAKAILADAIKTFGLDKNAKLPLSKEMTKDPNASPNAKKPKKVATGKLILKCKSKRAPAVFDSRGREINPKGLDIRGGTVARVQGFLSPYEMLEKIKNADGEIEEVTVTGISFTLTGVQIIRLAKGFGSKGFDAYDDDGEGWTMSGDDAGDISIGEDAEDDAVSSEDDGGVLDI